MLTAAGLSKRFVGRAVLKGVGSRLAPGEAVGLIGRSGCGKSTFAKCVVGLESHDAGALSFDGAPLRPGRGAARRRIQYVWQDATQALSPYLSIRGAVLETLNGFRIGPRAGRTARADALLASLGIDAAMARRRADGLSGGRRQRAAIARALAAEPDMLILDEPFASLDLVTQAATLGTLRAVRSRTGCAMLVISHDLATLRRLVDRIDVLDEGGIVESHPVATFAETARHPLARAFLAADADLAAAIGVARA